jgi:hypothetical protein
MDVRQLTSQRKQCAQPSIAQVQPSPDQHAENDGDEERLTDAHVGGDRAAEIACQQDRAENGGARDHIDDGTSDLEDPEAESKAFVPSEVFESLPAQSIFFEMGAV